jgi:Nucleotidyl transferase AbiEii toxin, Type IV TA system
MEPTRPKKLPEHAERAVRAVAGAGLGHKISVGGALGLQHYLDYRPTNDVDAWWTASADLRERAEVVRVVEEALAEQGEVRTQRCALDSLADLIASKMVALVERGAPRDFRDIYTLCQAGLTSAGACWRLWRERQHRAGSDVDPHRARLAVETQLTRIALHRPLDRIADPEERAQSQRVRTWVEEELLDALVD